MFTIKRAHGQHTVHTLDTVKHKFREYFEQLYETQDLEHLHKGSTEFTGSNLQDIETSLHKRFYADIKTNPQFKRLYCALIKDIYTHILPEEEYMIYQSFPSVRFQFPNNMAVPPHYDSDHIGCHPLGEKNFLLPITEMSGSRRLFVESEPRKEDFQGIDLEYGELFHFNGNTCTHYNQKNTDDILRISLDFRVLKRADYIHYIESGKITTTNPRDPDKQRVPVKMVIGGYYQCSKYSDSLEQMMAWHKQGQLLMQSKPNFDHAEAQACYDYMKDGTNFVTEFKQTEALEKMIAEYTGAKHCIMTTSGNMAIILALMALDLEPGDEVIVPNYTMIATINSVRMVGLKPVLVDVNQSQLTLDLATIQKATTEKTKAILHVSLNNRHTDLAGIAEYCEKHKIVLIEDAAQSLGSKIDGKHIGTFGKIGCFSLSTPKIISTGQGGFLITDDSDLARKLGMIKNFGRKCGGIDVFETFGINAKFTDIQAVIGLEQMKKLPGRVIRLQEIWARYYSKLQQYMIPPTYDGWLPWFVDIFIKDRDALVEFLKVHNVQTRPTYPEIHKTPMYAEYQDHKFPVSEYVSAQGLFLPTHTCITNEEIDYVCKLVEFYLC